MRCDLGIRRQSLTANVKLFRFTFGLQWLFTSHVSDFDSTRQLRFVFWIFESSFVYEFITTAQCLSISFIVSITSFNLVKYSAPVTIEENRSNGKNFCEVDVACCIRTFACFLGRFSVKVLPGTTQSDSAQETRFRKSKITPQNLHKILFMALIGCTR